ncbi:MAG: acylphosphatase [Bacteroidales bacterium]|nr:acylphosphatase [Bacteroidales bacterium]
MGNSNEIIRVFGRVQGVGFRYSAHQAATGLGLYGFVRNEPDGSVTIEAEGPKEQINMLIEWCRKGPARAEVHEIKHYPGQLMNYTSFRIR